MASLSAIVNQDICLPKDIDYFANITLNESLYELKTHKAIVRASERLKERGEPINIITISSFLSSHKIPATINEENELLEIFSGRSATKAFFETCIQAIEKDKLKRFRI